MGVREKFQERSWRYLSGNTFEEPELSEEEEFLQSVYKAIKERMGEYRFSVTDLAAELNMSERSLYRRVKALTEHTVAGLIREVRLQRARELVEKQRVKTKSELAKRVGFKSVKHFKRAYHQRFGEALSI